MPEGQAAQRRSARVSESPPETFDARPHGFNEEAAGLPANKAAVALTRCTAAPTWTTTSYLCLLVSAAQAVLCTWALYRFDISGPFTDHIPENIEMFKYCSLLLVPFLAVEVLYSTVEVIRPNFRPNVIVASRLTSVELLVQVTYYTVLAQNRDGYARLNARLVGDPMPIYLPRMYGWCVAIPLLQLLNNYPLMDNVPFLGLTRRMAPLMLTSVSYCATCHLGSVIADAEAGWALIAVSCIAYGVSVLDQVTVMVQRFGMTDHCALKNWSICVREVMFLLYVFTWVAGTLGGMRSIACERFFSYADVFCKGFVVVCLHAFHLIKPDEKLD